MRRLRAYLRPDRGGRRIRAADLCKQMLAYAGKGRFVIGRARPQPGGARLRELLRLSISRRPCCGSTWRPNCPSIQADAPQMQQVIMNLVLNASEALVGGEGGIDGRDRASTSRSTRR